MLQELAKSPKQDLKNYLRFPLKRRADIECSIATVDDTCLLLSQARDQAKTGGYRGPQLLQTDCGGPYWDESMWKGYMDFSASMICPECPMRDALTTLLTDLTNSKIQKNELI